MRTTSEQSAIGQPRQSAVVTIAAVTVVLVAGATLQVETATAVVRHLGLRQHHVQSAAETRAVAQLMLCLAEAARQFTPDGGKPAPALAAVTGARLDRLAPARDHANAENEQLLSPLGECQFHLIDLPPPAGQC